MKKPNFLYLNKILIYIEKIDINYNQYYNYVRTIRNIEGKAGTYSARR